MWYSQTTEGEVNMDELNGAKLDLNLDDLFKDEDDPAAGTPPADDKLDLTEKMTKRINEVKAKTEATVRDNIAKELGFDDYASMQKAKAEKTITEAGYNPEEIQKLVEPMLEARLASDPRLQKLAALEEKEKQAYINAELAKIEKLTGLKVKETDLSKETLDVWGKGVDLAQAYIATNSNAIISGNTKGSTDHLASGNGASKPKMRGLTQSEKALFKSISPNITDEELNKKMMEVK